MVKFKKFFGRNFFRHRRLTECEKMNSHWAAVLPLNRNICRERPIICWRTITSQVSERPVIFWRKASYFLANGHITDKRTVNFKISEQPTFVSETSPDIKNYTKNYTNCLERACHSELRDF